MHSRPGVQVWEGILHAQEVKPADRLGSCETMDSPAPEVAGELSACRDKSRKLRAGPFKVVSLHRRGSM